LPITTYSLQWPGQDFLAFIANVQNNRNVLPISPIIKNDFKFPKYVNLFEESKLNHLLKKSEYNHNYSDKLYSNDTLSNLFIFPLTNELKNVNTLFISPAKLGHQVNFSALPINHQTLGEKYNVSIFGSPSELIGYSTSILYKTTKPELILYGDIDYDKLKNSNIQIRNEKDKTFTDDFNSLVTRSGITQWSYLPGTADEIRIIKHLANDKQFKTTVFNDQKATKENILKLDGRKSIYVLHLATHGFFFPDPKRKMPDQLNKLMLNNSFVSQKNIHKVSEDPMLRSGLLFAGANKYWGKDLANTTVNNGILTAREISNLDLSGCELVVMSACDTGLGDIKGSEGVFGLQRAFKMAGVKNMIMSLWQVPDKETSELFTEFYKLTFEGKSIHQAFKLAQLKMKEKYDPYYWAGFVLLE